MGASGIEQQTPVEPTDDGIVRTAASENGDVPEPMDRQAVAHAFGWSILFSLISKVIFPIGSIIISRTLGPAQTGMFGLIAQIIAFSEIFRDAGLSQSFLAEAHVDRAKERSYATLAVLTGIVPALVLCAVASPLAQFFRLPELVWALPLVSIVLVVNGFATIPRAKMLKAGEIKRTGALEMTGGAIGLAVAITLVLLGVGFEALIAQMLIGSVFVMATAWFRFPVPGFSLSGADVRTTLRRAGTLFAANGLNNLFLFADTFVVTRVAGETANGLFLAAKNLAYKPADFLIFPLTRTLMVAFSQSAGNLERLNRVYAKSLTGALLMVLPIYALLAVFSFPIMDLLLGPQFRGSELALTAMSVYLTFRVFGNISGHALVPAGRHAMTLWPWIGCLVVTAVALWVAIPMGGFMPIVWSFTIGAAFVYGALLALGLRYCPPPEGERARLSKAALVAGIDLAILLGLRMIPIPASYTLAVACAIGPFVHFGLVGTFFAGNVLAYLNRSGPRRLWEEL